MVRFESSKIGMAVDAGGAERHGPVLMHVDKVSVRPGRSVHMRRRVAAIT